jgi:hypothetical protein
MYGIRLGSVGVDKPCVKLKSMTLAALDAATVAAYCGQPTAALAPVVMTKGEKAPVVKQSANDTSWNARFTLLPSVAMCGRSVLLRAR